MPTSDGRTRGDSITLATKRCLVCKHPGFLMWYKINHAQIPAYGLDSAKYWKQLVCNHFIDGQSKDRNRFCFYEDVVGRKAIREALHEEVDLTYHIIGSERPRWK